MPKKGILGVAIVALLCVAGGLYLRHGKSGSEGVTPASANEVTVSPEVTPSLPSIRSRAMTAPPGNSISLDALINKAKNDPKLAYDVSLMLMNCRRFAKAYDAAADVNESSRPGAAEKMLDQADAARERCAGITQHQLDEYRYLIEISAEGGNVAAQLNYTDILAETILSPASIANPSAIEKYKRKSIEYLSKAAMAGEPTALMKLSTAYEDGILVGKNRGVAYKYAYAYSLAKPGRSSSSWVQFLEKGMSAQEVRQAQTLGEEYFRSCCR